MSERAAPIDYAAVGFLAGLEIHQQLDTPKLFCRCASRLDEEVDVRFERALRPTQSELGEVDRAALAEARKRLVFDYQASRHTSCLVEMDEEPPHDLTPEAVAAALEISLLLDARPVDEIHVMRKIVIDGSNTSGFQRTALFALGGRVDSSRGPVGIDTLALEEDSARKLDRKGNVVAYRLDRLGIPLVEIATAPEIKGPEHAAEVALAIGMALRATGKVKRGLGTIRQDLNVSIRDGARIEIKGVQDLKLIPVAVEYEVRRQLRLLDVRAELARRGAKPEDVAGDLHDLTPLFAGTEAKLIHGALKAGGVVLAVALPRFAGLLGKKAPAKPGEVPEPRLGKEFADYAKVRAGVKGIFHSDELPAYGVTDAEVEAVRTALRLGPQDAFVLVAEARPVAERALEAVADRARMTFQGVPEETRDVLEDGSSQYLRPLPGGARMYPETDVPPFRITPQRIADVRAHLPELLPAKEARLKREHPDVSAEQMSALVRAGDADLFERLAKATRLPKETARVLVNTLPELEAEGLPRERVAEVIIRDTLLALKAGAFAKEAVPAILKHLATRGGTPKEAVKALGLARADLGAVERAVDQLIEERAQFVLERGAAAAGPLMGPLMAQFKGQVPGQDLSRILNERIARFVATRKG